MLSPYRALDLTDEKGFLCGKILGELGADVIKVEKPGGDPARNIGPFYHDIPDPEKSLFWFAFNANKRGITLDINTSDGREIFKRLVETADFVLECFPPGYMDALGLGYSQLVRLNPRIILTSITPFGQTGPYRDYQASDLQAMAMGGLMYICGYPDQPPLRLGFYQAYVNAGAQAALGTLIAHYFRETTGEGQHVDVSLCESIVPLLLNARNFWEFRGSNVRRAAPYRRIGSMAGVRTVWPCKDGYVSFTLFGGGTRPWSNQRLVQWMDSEGLAPDALKNIDWAALDMSTATQEELDRFCEPIGNFLMQHTKAELYQGARDRGIMIYPDQTVKDIAEDPQLRARDFWIEVEHPEFGTSIPYPGFFIKSSETSCCIRRRAPLIGEHNEEIYRELGLSQEELILLKQGGVI